MAYRVGIADFGDSWSGFAFDLPGCTSTAESRSDLLRLLPVSIAEHAGWLRQHGHEAPAQDAVEVDVVEEVRTDDEDGVEGEFIFDDDRRPLTGDEIEDCVAVMVSSRADLLAAIDGVPDIILDWRPPSSALARMDPWNPAPRTIREIRAGVAGAEGYYRTGLRDGPQDPATDPQQNDLAVQRELLIDPLHALRPENRGRVFRPRRAWQEGHELWTARKVVRRVIGHERFHTAEIRQRLAWLLVGVPDFGARISPGGAQPPPAALHADG